MFYFIFINCFWGGERERKTHSFSINTPYPLNAKKIRLSENTTIASVFVYSSVTKRMSVAYRVSRRYVYIVSSVVFLYTSVEISAANSPYASIGRVKQLLSL